MRGRTACLRRDAAERRQLAHPAASVALSRDAHTQVAAADTALSSTKTLATKTLATKTLTNCRRRYGERVIIHDLTFHQ
jgi:TnpA family transposase